MQTRLPQNLLIPAPVIAEANLFQGGVLPPRSVRTFLEFFISGRPDLIERLFLDYGAQYTGYALKLSTEMRNTTIETDGGHMMISGFAGHTIIFGRFDDPNSPEVGMSSCYFVVAEKRPVKLAEKKASMIISMA